MCPIIIKGHVMSRIEIETESTENTLNIDIERIKKYGELWAKKPNMSGHPSINTTSYVLLRDDPPRKKCFNTYNGKLGGSRSFETLELDDFVKNAEKQKSTYPIKNTMEKERKKLAQKGYKII